MSCPDRVFMFVQCTHFPCKCQKPSESYVIAHSHHRRHAVTTVIRSDAPSLRQRPYILAPPYRNARRLKRVRCKLVIRRCSQNNRPHRFDRRCLCRHHEGHGSQSTSNLQGTIRSYEAAQNRRDCRASPVRVVRRRQVDSSAILLTSRPGTYFDKVSHLPQV